jgi:hypothetical protein
MSDTKQAGCRPAVETSETGAIPKSRLSTQVYTPTGRQAAREAENRIFFFKIGDDSSARRFVKRDTVRLEK